MFFFVKSKKRPKSDIKEIFISGALDPNALPFTLYIILSVCYNI